jgi:hypothetical protein
VTLSRWLVGVDDRAADRRLYPMFDRGSGTSSRRPRGLFDGVVDTWRRTPDDLWNKATATSDHLAKHFEFVDRWLGETSPLAQHVAQPLQRWAFVQLGAPNEQVYRGRDGWLFFRPAVDYVTGPSFLDPRALDRAGTRAADPRPAIFAFADALRARGIDLVLVPTPVKLTVHPEKFTTRAITAPIQNPSFAQFVAECTARGVMVFDPAPLLVQRARDTGEAQFLATDTHWTPAAMRAVAQRLAAELRPRLPERAPTQWVELVLPVHNRGDLAAMLDLPKDGERYGGQLVETCAVGPNPTTPWQSDPSADVLLLGDSYTNIYSALELGWGIAAGFAEHLALALQRPLHRIARNDDGAFATREALRRHEGDPLQGKRLVVWQFAARELTRGDWR